MTNLAYSPGAIPLRAGCARSVCAVCGAPKRDVRRRAANPDAFAMTLRDAQAGKPPRPGKRQLPAEVVNAYNDRAYTAKPSKRVVAPGCGCNKPFRRGVVLDPFCGTATTGVVARRIGLDFIGFEINATYARQARERLRAGAPAK